MAVQKPVPANRIRDIIEISALRNTPVALTCRVDGAWRNYRSRFLGAQGGLAWIEYPVDENGNDPGISTEDRIGVAFKQRHHKYVFSAEVRETAEFNPSFDVNINAICVSWPDKMHQLQRRMFQRVDVPHGQQVYLEFWQGGKAAEPDGPLREKLVFTSQLVDLSAGGFQVRLLGENEPKFQESESIGVSMLADTEKPIKFDASFRHINSDEFGTTLGMQIVGLNHTSQGRRVLERIGTLIRSFLDAGSSTDSESSIRTMS